MLLQDIAKGNDPQILASLAVLSAVAPDLVVLTDFDHDLDQQALSAFAAAAGMAHYFSLPPNTGLPTGEDIDGNGRLAEARDMQGYGRFLGDGGMAVLSRYPILTGQATDLSGLLWAEFPGATLPDPMTEAVAAVQRLSTTGHWIVPIAAPGGPVTLLASAHTPPVFDGPEDRNGLRNRDELLVWRAVLDGKLAAAPQDFVIAANFNLDPADGEGIRADLAAFLSDPRLQDPRPTSTGGALAASPGHAGDPAVDTADWAETGPGNLRVSYVLPAAAWQVAGAGVFWPAPDAPEAGLLGGDGAAAGPHHLVWVDIVR